MLWAICSNNKKDFCRDFFAAAKKIFFADFSSVKALSMLESFLAGKEKTISVKKIKHLHSHKKLTLKFVLGINAPVTRITVLETSEGTGERSREALGESKGRAVCSCY